MPTTLLGLTQGNLQGLLSHCAERFQSGATDVRADVADASIVAVQCMWCWEI